MPNVPWKPFFPKKMSNKDAQLVHNANLLATLIYQRGQEGCQYFREKTNKQQT